MGGAEVVVFTRTDQVEPGCLEMIEWLMVLAAAPVRFRGRLLVHAATKNVPTGLPGRGTISSDDLFPLACPMGALLFYRGTRA